MAVEHTDLELRRRGLDQSCQFRSHRLQVVIETMGPESMESEQGREGPSHIPEEPITFKEHTQEKNSLWEPRKKGSVRREGKKSERAGCQ